VRVFNGRIDFTNTVRVRCVCKISGGEGGNTCWKRVYLEDDAKIFRPV